VCCSTLQNIAACCSVLPRLAVKTRQTVSAHRAVAPLAIMGVLQRAIVTGSGLSAVCLQMGPIWIRKCVLKTAAYFVSLSSVPALLPPIFIFVMSIEMTMLGRDVW